MRMGDTSARGTTRQLQGGPLGWTGAGGPRRAGAAGRRPPASRPALPCAHHWFGRSAGIPRTSAFAAAGSAGPSDPRCGLSSPRAQDVGQRVHLATLSPASLGQAGAGKALGQSGGGGGGLRNKEINALRRPSQPTPRPVSAPPPPTPRLPVLSFTLCSSQVGGGEQVDQGQPPAPAPCRHLCSPAPGHLLPQARGLLSHLQWLLVGAPGEVCPGIRGVGGMSEQGEAARRARWHFPPILGPRGPPCTRPKAGTDTRG